ncbi:MAG: hypothetical protein CM1200mP1_13910 [Candidatus Neomarinimicrobiota bacterium]|nr:MAG: hypothetical protein CM1200mP1_13910 [Candidatus Neomarinimicrobiota bacterium]
MGDPTGRNHAAFPFLSQSTGQFYVVGGDEIFPWGVMATQGKPSNPRGGFHFLNFTDPDNPKEDAIYQVPEAALIIYGYRRHTYCWLLSRGLRIVIFPGNY